MQAQLESELIHTQRSLWSIGTKRSLEQLNR